MPGHGMPQMAQQRLLIPDGHRTHYRIGFVRYAVRVGPVSTIPQRPHSNCMPVYLHLFKKHTVRKCMTACTGIIKK